MTPKTMDLIREHLQKTGGQVCRIISRSIFFNHSYSGYNTISTGTKWDFTYWSCKSN
jgi:hypothetical protein